MIILKGEMIMREIPDIQKVMAARHSVRRYLDKPVEEEIAQQLRSEIESVNNESGLKFSLVLNEPEVFKANEPKYGSFSGCRNYIIAFGPKGTDEKTGFYGEHLVLFAQSLGLNTCWCALTFEKKKLPVDAPAGMVLRDVIALGYGATQGHEHKNKPIEKLAKITSGTPQWFLNGVEAAMLAPTAINQQKFRFEITEKNRVKAKALLGPCSKTDLGIVKYHFICGAGKENFEWD